MKNFNINELERWLKRCLKEKVSINDATVVRYCMMGMVGLFLTTSLPVYGGFVANHRSNHIQIGNATSDSHNIAIGEGAQAGSHQGMKGADVNVAIGTSSRANGVSNLAIGGAAEARGRNATSFGKQAISESGGVALGSYSHAKERGTAVGYFANASTVASVALGRYVVTEGAAAIGIGGTARASGAAAIAIGSAMGDENDTRDGDATKASGAHSIAMGHKTVASAEDSLAFGREAKSSGGASIAMGRKTNVSGLGSIGIGTQSGSPTSVAGAWGVAIGNNTKITSGNDVLALGSNISASGNSAVAIGNSANVSTEKSVVIGNEASASIGAGRPSNTADKGENSVVIGTSAKSTAQSGIAIGASSNAQTNRAIAIGDEATSLWRGVAIGPDAKVTQANAVAIGSESEAKVAASKGVKQGFVNPAGYTDANNRTWTGSSVFSIGKSSHTRQIKHLAAGKDDTDAVNVAQLKSLGLQYKGNSGSGDLAIWDGTLEIVGEGRISTKAENGKIKIRLNETGLGGGSNLKYFSTTNFSDNTNKNNDEAKGANSLAIGNAKVPSGSDRAIAIGTISAGQANNPITTANGSTSIAIGSGAQTVAGAGNDAIAIGRLTSSRTGSVVLGGTAKTSGGDYGVVIGYGANGTANNAVAIGRSSTSGENAVAIGGSSEANGYSVAVGQNAQAKNTGSAAFGENTRANSERATALGNNAHATANNATAVGYVTRANGVSSVALGHSANATGARAVAVGNNVLVDGDDTTALGNDIQTYRTSGQNKVGKAVWSVALGKQLKVHNTEDGQINNTVLIGTEGTVNKSYGIGIGFNTLNKAEESIAIGRNTKVNQDGAKAIAIGSGANTNIEGAIALGSEAVSNRALNDGSTTGYDVLADEATTETSATWKATRGALSIGDTNKTRQITNVAAGREDTDAVNVAQLKRAAIRYVSIKSSEDGNKQNNGATGQDSIAIGPNATTTGASSITIGTSGTSNGTKYTSSNKGVFSTALGIGANIENGADRSTAIGFNVKINNGNSDKALVIGSNSTLTNSEEGILLGEGATLTNATHSIGIGAGSSVTSTHSIAIGKSSKTTNVGAVALGENAQALNERATALGNNSKTEGKYGTAVGYLAKASDEYSIALGGKAASLNKYSLAVGAEAKAAEEGASAIGVTAQAKSKYSTAIGPNAKAETTQSIVIGTSAYAKEKPRDQDASGQDKGENAVVIGSGAYSEAQSGISIGSQAKTHSNRSIAIGDKAESRWYGVAIGADAKVENTNSSVAIGHNSIATGDTSLGAKQTFADVTDYTNNNKTWKGSSIFSVGSTTHTRQIKNVAAGTSDTDAVNVAQLQSLHLQLKSNNDSSTGKLKIWDGTLKFKGENGISTSVDGDTIRIKYNGNNAMPLIYNGGNNTNIGTQVQTTSNPLKLDFGDGLKAEKVGSGNNERVLITLDKDTLANDSRFKGPKGDRGEKGETGATGAKGDRGDIGPAGPMGPAGPQGVAGPKGETGATGPAGPRGERGEAGQDGAPGPKGDKGEVGPQGPQGIAGDTGPAGPRGPEGQPGRDGNDGAPGERGPIGPEGPRGPKGDQGVAGAQGPQGDKGETGERGPEGPQGPRGERGEAGPQGEQGVAGAQGPKGEKGDTGDVGPMGPAGPQGERGFSGGGGSDSPFEYRLGTEALTRIGDNYYKTEEVKDYIYDKNENKFVNKDGQELNAQPTAIEDGEKAKIIISEREPSSKQVHNVASGIDPTNIGNGKISDTKAKELIAGNDGSSGLLGLNTPEALNKVATVGDLQAVAQAGLDFTGNNADVVVHRPLGTTLKVIGSEKDNQKTYSSSNITTVGNKTDGSITIEFKETPEFKGVTLKDGAKEVTLTPSAENTLKLGGTSGTAPVKIDNLADGNIADNSKEAITGKQLKDLADKAGIDLADNSTTAFKTPEINKLKDKAGQDITPTGTVSLRSSINSVIDRINDGLTFGADTGSSKQYLGSKLEVKTGATSDGFVGDNIETKYENKGGDGTITIGLSKTPTFDSLTANKSISVSGITLNNDGIAMGDKKITGLKAGVDGTDAVNKSQLDANKSIVTVNNGKSDNDTTGPLKLKTTPSATGTTYDVSLDVDNNTIVVENGKLKAVIPTVDIPKGEIKTENGMAAPNANTDNDKLTTVATVVKAINDSSFKVKTEQLTTDGTSSPNTTGVDIKAGNEIAFKAAKNLVVAQDDKNITFGLSKTLTDLTSVETKDQDGNKTTLTKDGITITPVTPANGKTAVSLTKDGLNNGNNRITNVATPTVDTDAANKKYVDDSRTTVTSSDNSIVVGGPGTGANKAYDIKVASTTLETSNGSVTTLSEDNKNKFVTAENIANAINATGFNVAAGTNTKLINPGKTVKFVNGNATTPTVTAKDDGAEVKFDINIDDSTLEITNDGKLKAKVPTIDTGTIATNNGVAEVNNGDGDKLATVSNVTDAINNSSFKLKTKQLNTAIETGENTTGVDIKAGNEIDLRADKNLLVKQEDKVVTFGLSKTLSGITSIAGDAGAPTITLGTDNTVSVGNSRITNVGSPTTGTDAANRDYVDNSRTVVESGNTNTITVTKDNNVTTHNKYTVTPVIGDVADNNNNLVTGDKVFDAVSSARTTVAKDNADTSEILTISGGTEDGINPKAYTLGINTDKLKDVAKDSVEVKRADDSSTALTVEKDKVTDDHKDTYTVKLDENQLVTNISTGAEIGANKTGGNKVITDGTLNNFLKSDNGKIGFKAGNTEEKKALGETIEFVGDTNLTPSIDNGKVKYALNSDLKGITSISNKTDGSGSTITLGDDSVVVNKPIYVGSKDDNKNKVVTFNDIIPTELTTATGGLVNTPSEDNKNKFVTAGNVAATINALGNNTIKLGGNTGETKTISLNNNGGILFNVKGATGSGINVTTKDTSNTLDIDLDPANLSNENKTKWKNILGVGSSSIAYKLNGAGDKSVPLTTGFDFTNGTNTTAEIGDNGVVKFNLNSDLTGISSIKNGNSGPTITLGNNDNTIDVGGARITNVGSPTAGTDAANKDYVDGTRTIVHSSDNSISVTEGIEGNAKKFDIKIDTTGFATTSLNNINNAGKDVIKGLINVTDGENTTVTSSNVGDVKTFVVNAIDRSSTVSVNTQTLKLTTGTEAKNGNNTLVTNHELDLSDPVKATLARVGAGSVLDPDNRTTTSSEVFRAITAAKPEFRLNNDVNTMSILTLDLNEPTGPYKHTYKLTVNQEGLKNIVGLDFALKNLSNIDNDGKNVIKNLIDVENGKNTTITATEKGGKKVISVDAVDKSSKVTTTGTAISITPKNEVEEGNTTIKEFEIDLSEATKADIQKGVDAKNKVDNQGITFAGNTGTATTKKLGETVNITAEGTEITAETKVTNDGIVIKVDASALKNAITANTNEISTLKDNSLTFKAQSGADYVRKNSENGILTIQGGDTDAGFVGTNVKTKIENGAISIGFKESPTFKSVSATESISVAGITLNNNGISMGDKKITGLKAGVDGTDAVNVSQLDAARTTVSVNAENATGPLELTTTDNANGQGKNYNISLKLDEDTLEVTNDGKLKAIIPTVDIPKGSIKTENGIASPNTEADGEKLVTVGNVAEAINNSSFKVKTEQLTTDGESSPNTTGADIKAGNTVSFRAAKNLTIKQDDKVITYGLNPVLQDINSITGKGNTLSFNNGNITSNNPIFIGNNTDDNNKVVTLGDLKDTNDKNKTRYVSIKEGTSDKTNDETKLKSNYTNEGATGLSAIAIGRYASAKGSYATSLGTGSSANLEDTLAIGNYSLANGRSSVALGYSSETTGTNSVAIGTLSKATSEGGVALGTGSLANTEREKYGYRFDGINSQEDLLEALGKKEEYENLERNITEKSAELERIRAEVKELETTNQDVSPEKQKELDDKETEVKALVSNKNKLISTWKSTLGAISVGNSETGDTRQITGVAAGSEDTDAVNLAQLKDLADKTITFKAEFDTTEGIRKNSENKTFNITSADTNGIEKDSFKFVGDNLITKLEQTTDGAKISIGLKEKPEFKELKLKNENNTVTLTPSAENTLTLGGTITDNKAAPVKIENLADGNIEDSSKEAITGKQLKDLAGKAGIIVNGTKFDSPVFEKLSKVDGNFETDETKLPKSLKEAIDETRTRINDGFKFAGNVYKDGTTENDTQYLSSRTTIKAGDLTKDTAFKETNLKTEYSYDKTTGNGTITIGLKEAVTFKTVTASDSISITNGPKLLTTGIDAGNKVISNVATPNNDNDATNKSYVDTNRTEVKSEDGSITIDTKGSTNSKKVYDLKVTTTTLAQDSGGKITIPVTNGDKFVTAENIATAINKLGSNTIKLTAGNSSTTAINLNKEGGIEFKFEGENGITTSIDVNDKSKIKIGLNTTGVNISYKANNDAISKTTSLLDGFKFSDGNNTNAEVADGGIVKFNLNKEVKNISSIGGGRNDAQDAKDNSTIKFNKDDITLENNGANLVIKKDDKAADGKALATEDTISLTGLTDRTPLTTDGYGASGRAATELAVKEVADTSFTFSDGTSKGGTENTFVRKNSEGDKKLVIKSGENVTVSLDATKDANKTGEFTVSLNDKLLGITSISGKEEDGNKSTLTFNKDHISSDKPIFIGVKNGDNIGNKVVTFDDLKDANDDISNLSPFEYKDDKDNTLVKIGDDFYKKSDVDGKVYDKDTGKFKDGITGEFIEDDKKPSAIEKSKVVISSKTKNPSLEVTNVASGIDKSKIGLASIKTEVAKDLINGKDGLNNITKVSDLNKVATVGDLQALSIAGLDFEGNIGKSHNNLGSKLSIVGGNEDKFKLIDAIADETTKKSELKDFVSKFSDRNLITEAKNGEVKIKFAEKPVFKGITVADEANRGKQVDINPEGVTAVTEEKDTLKVTTTNGEGVAVAIVKKDPETGLAVINGTEPEYKKVANYDANGLKVLDIENGNKFVEVNPNEISLGKDDNKSVTIKPSDENTDAKIELKSKDGTNTLTLNDDGRITGLKAGVKGTDAVNVSQLNAAKTDVESTDNSVNITERKDATNKNTIYNLSVNKATLSVDKDGNVNSSSTGNSFVTGDNLATVINKVASSSKTEVEEGKNIVVTERKGDKDQVIYNVSVNDRPDFKEVTVADPSKKGKEVQISPKGVATIDQTGDKLKYSITSSEGISAYEVEKDPATGNPILENGIPKVIKSVEINPNKIELKNAGNTLTLNDDGSITGVKAGVDDKDAVNVSQLKDFKNKVENESPFEYRDKDNNPLVKIGDNFYKKSDVDGKVYDKDTGKFKDPITGKELTVQPEVIDKDKVVISSKTDSPLLEVTNVASGLDKTKIGVEDPNNKSKAKKLTPEEIKDLAKKLNGLDKVTDLNKVATIGDLQALSLAGLDFDGNIGEVHNNLGTKLSIIGGNETRLSQINASVDKATKEKDLEKFISEFNDKNIITESKVVDGINTVKIKFAKNPDFEGITITKEGLDTKVIINPDKVVVVNTKGDTIKSTITTEDGTAVTVLKKDVDGNPIIDPLTNETVVEKSAIYTAEKIALGNGKTETVEITGSNKDNSSKIVLKDKDGGPNILTLNGDGRITGVKAGVDATDAVNVSQLEKATNASKTEVESSDNSVNITERKDDKDNHIIYDLSVNKATLNVTELGEVSSNKSGNAFVTGDEVSNSINKAAAAARTEVVSNDDSVVVNKNKNGGVNGNDIYEISIKKDGKVEDGNNSLVTGDTVYKAIKKAVDSSKTELEEGKNIVITERMGDKDQIIYNVSVNDRPDFKEVTIADPDKKGKEVQISPEGVSTIDQTGENLKFSVTNAEGLNVSIVQKDKDGNPVLDPKTKDPIFEKTATYNAEGLRIEDNKNGNKFVDIKPNEISLGKENDKKVVINGEDASIGLDGTIIKTKDNRIVYTPNGGKEESVATLNDGLKFKGDSGNTINKKLNETLNIVGGASDETELTNNNIGVISDGDGTLNIKLSKNLKGIDRISGLTNIDDNEKDGTVAVNKNYVDRKITSISNESSSGIANAIALANLTQVQHRGGYRHQISGGYGTYNGEHAFGVGLSGISKGGQIMYKASGSLNTRGKFAAGLGIGYQFDKEEEISSEVESNLKKEMNNLIKDNERLSRENAENKAKIEELINLVKENMKDNKPSKEIIETKETKEVRLESKLYTLNQFEFDKVKLTKPQLVKLKAIVQEINEKYSDRTIDITGYADIIGNENYNLDLGLDRANMVSDLMIEFGLKNPQNIRKVSSFGYNSKVSRDRKSNRRVEIEIK